MKRAVGFDLGTRNFGWFVLERAEGDLPFTAVAGGVVHTQADKSFGRKTWDDLRRLREIHNFIDQCLTQHAPEIIGFESYAVFDDNNAEDLKDQARELVGMFAGGAKAGFSPEQFKAALATNMFDRLLTLTGKMATTLGSMRATRGRGNAAKVLSVQGVVCATAFSRGLPVMPFTPADLKRRATNTNSASKEAVAVGLRRIVNEIGDALQSTPGGMQNHAYDAAGHAVLALEHSMGM